MHPWDEAELYSWWIVTGASFTSEVARVISDEGGPTFQLLPLPPAEPSLIGPGEITDATRMILTDAAGDTRLRRSASLLPEAQQICSQMLTEVQTATAVPGLTADQILENIAPLAEAAARLTATAEQQGA